MTTMTRFFPLGFVWLLCQGCVTTVSSTTIADEANSEEAAVANLNLGVAYYREGRLELALQRLESSLNQNPRLADAHSTIALVYDQLGEVDEAENHYRRATQLEPENPGAANSYAVFLCRNERWSDAERQFMRAARNPRYPTPEAAFTNAGICARDSGDNAAADGYFREALARNPGYPDALFNLTELSFDSENYLQARAFAQRYLESAPDNPQMFWLCFQVERQLDNGTGAQRCATQLREQFPGSAEMAQLDQLERNGEQ